MVEKSRERISNIVYHQYMLVNVNKKDIISLKNCLFKNGKKSAKYMHPPQKRFNHGMKN